jgi:hypothetical protein
MNQQQEQRHHTLLRMVTSGLLWLSKEADYQPVETALNLLVLWWTVLFFLSRDLFAISRVYDVMAVLAPQPIWGMVAALIVCWHSFSVTILRPYRWTRSVALLSIFAWNCFFGLVFAATGIASFGAGSHFIFAGLAAWALWRYAGRSHV